MFTPDSNGVKVAVKIPGVSGWISTSNSDTSFVKLAVKISSLFICKFPYWSRTSIIKVFSKLASPKFKPYESSAWALTILLEDELVSGKTLNYLGVVSL